MPCTRVLQRPACSRLSPRGRSTEQHRVCFPWNPLLGTIFYTANQHSFLQLPKASCVPRLRRNTHSDHVAEPADVLHGTREVQAGESLPQSAVAVPLENRQQSASDGPLSEATVHVSLQNGSEVLARTSVSITSKPTFRGGCGETAAMPTPSHPRAVRTAR